MLRRFAFQAIGVPSLRFSSNRLQTSVSRTLCVAASLDTGLEFPVRLTVASERGTAQIAHLLANERIAGDCICLYGTVGSGKSVFRCVNFSAYAIEISIVEVLAKCNLCRAFAAALL